MTFHRIAVFFASLCFVWWGFLTFGVDAQKSAHHFLIFDKKWKVVTVSVQLCCTCERSFVSYSSFDEAHILACSWWLFLTFDREDESIPHHFLIFDKKWKVRFRSFSLPNAINRIILYLCSLRFVWWGIGCCVLVMTIYFFRSAQTKKAPHHLLLFDKKWRWSVLFR